MLINKFKKLFRNDKFVNVEKLKFLGNRIYNPFLWYINKYSVSKGFFIGLFIAWMPLPFHTVLVAIFAFLFKANLIVSILVVWISNPITMPILFLFAYKVGCFFIEPLVRTDLNFSLACLFNKMIDIWQPFLLGCVLCAIFSSVVGIIFVRLAWRFFVIKSWIKRKKKSEL